LLKSEGYRLEVTDEQISGNTITFSAGEGFEGYKTAFYAVEPQEGGGVRVEFVSAEVTKEGEPVQQPHPQAPMFRLPRGARFVRLIYLKRLSYADHDMAVVAADTMGALNTLTREVQTRQSACKSDDRSFCSWVPAGIAVRPEVRRTVGSAESWESVR